MIKFIEKYIYWILAAIIIIGSGVILYVGCIDYPVHECDKYCPFK